MKKFGLLGFPLDHSFSCDYFTKKFENEGLDCTFENIALDNLKDIGFRTSGLNGFSVTIPHKREIMQHLDAISTEARVVGAVNCVHVDEELEALVGYNTDIGGFHTALVDMIGDRKPNALVLGVTGGAAAAVCYVLDKLHIKYTGVSRNGGDYLTYADIDEQVMRDCTLIINCSPVGTYPNVDQSPDIPYQHITQEHYLFDLVYNPSETAFMRHGRYRGAMVKNGYQMLCEQAEQAWKIWSE